MKRQNAADFLEKVSKIIGECDFMILFTFLEFSLPKLVKGLAAISCGSNLEINSVSGFYRN